MDSKGKMFLYPVEIFSRFAVSQSLHHRSDLILEEFFQQMVHKELFVYESSNIQNSDSSIRIIGCFTDGMSIKMTFVRESGCFTDGIQIPPASGDPQAVLIYRRLSRLPARCRPCRSGGGGSLRWHGRPVRCSRLRRG